MVRLATLSVFVVAIGMIGSASHARRAPGSSSASAAVIVAVGGGGAARRSRAASRRGWRSPGATQAFLLALRRTGLPLLGLAFFLTWTLVYVALWAVHPHVRRSPGIAAAAALRRLLLLRGLAPRSSRRPAISLAHSRGARSGDDDRDADRVRAAHDLPLELRRLAAPATAKARASATSHPARAPRRGPCRRGRTGRRRPAPRRGRARARARASSRARG